MYFNIRYIMFSILKLVCRMCKNPLKEMPGSVDCSAMNSYTTGGTGGHIMLLYSTQS